MLEQNIAGLTFKNPIIAASGCFGFGMEYKSIFDPNILGAITLQTITVNPTLPLKANRLAEVKSGIIHSTGWENPGLDYITKTLKISLEKNFQVPLIASIGGSSPSEYEILAQSLNEMNSIAALEINASCLNTPAMYFSIDDICNIIRSVKKVTTKPIFLKLSPFSLDLERVIKEAENLGVSGFTLINNIPAMRIDTKRSKKPILSTKIGGLGGSSLMSVALAVVFKAREYTKLPIIGTGGVDTLDDAIEFLLAGASLVGIGSGFFKNPLCAQSIVEALPDYLSSQGFKQIKELIGLAHLS